MNERDLTAFLEMGGYALYVWGSFAMCAVAALWEWVLLLHRRRRTLQDLQDDLPRVAAAHGARDGT